MGAQALAQACVCACPHERQVWQWPCSVQVTEAGPCRVAITATIAGMVAPRAVAADAAPAALHRFSEHCERHERLLREVHPSGANGPPEALFHALAASGAFRECWLGGLHHRCRGPFLLPRIPWVDGVMPLAHLAGGLRDATDAGVNLEAASSLHDGTSWTRHIDLPPIHEDAELRDVLRFGTLFFNKASSHWKILAAVALATVRHLGFPANINIYVTAPGLKVSTPVHCDNHDVLILQSAGRKRWMVYAPPPPSRSGCRRLYRGKDGDVLTTEELGEPLLDATLAPGEVLFVPMGFAHATSTVDCCADGSVGGGANASLHLTLGISAADWQLCAWDARKALLNRLGRNGRIDEQALAEEDYWMLQVPLPLGCLAGPVPPGADCPRGLPDLLAALLLEACVRCGPGESNSTAAAVAALRATARATAEEWIALHRRIISQHVSGFLEILAAPGAVISTPALLAAPRVGNFVASMLGRREVKMPPVGGERRIDPEDGGIRAFDEVCQRYSDRWGEDENRYYFYRECRAIDEDEARRVEAQVEVARVESVEAYCTFLAIYAPELRSRRRLLQPWGRGFILSAATRLRGYAIALLWPPVFPSSLLRSPGWRTAFQERARSATSLQRLLSNQIRTDWRTFLLVSHTQAVAWTIAAAMLRADILNGMRAPPGTPPLEVHVVNAGIQECGCPRAVFRDLPMLADRDVRLLLVGASAASPDAAATAELAPLVGPDSAPPHLVVEYACEGGATPCEGFCGIAGCSSAGPHSDCGLRTPDALLVCEPTAVRAGVLLPALRRALRAGTLVVITARGASALVEIVAALSPLLCAARFAGPNPFGSCLCVEQDVCVRPQSPPDAIDDELESVLAAAAGLLRAGDHACELEDPPPDTACAHSHWLGLYGAVPDEVFEAVD
eukprot:NODE_428_length_3061_cov_6.380368.p1 GENE.NODE_428_length_3061_cov_6.380368~~NODE_428_length_3061_cov_6.380368.p1  ORF type:complete len:906 (-),score=269.07 NODE_428_length_3061_cov_6.380368:342-3059(-)